MTETNVFQLTQPGTFSDPLTEVLRNGARTLLGQAVEAEVAAWLSTHTDKFTDDGRGRLVRHGHLPEREIMTGSRMSFRWGWSFADASSAQPGTRRRQATRRDP